MKCPNSCPAPQPLTSGTPLPASIAPALRVALLRMSRTQSAKDTVVRGLRALADNKKASSMVDEAFSVRTTRPGAPSHALHRHYTCMFITVV
ncbi:AAA family ATPase [Pandoraea soli]|uniref:AAA family ATPase n=1 Tax=Pandoraea soli TaxID=2508293 RepID=A0ABY6W628_9BURK|nr:AAA family ATPase [Pandoraea soli]